MARYYVHRDCFMECYGQERLKKAHEICKEALIELGYELQPEGYWYQSGTTDTCVSFQFDKCWFRAIVSGQIICLRVHEGRDFNDFFYDFLCMAGRLIHVNLLNIGEVQKDHFVPRNVFGDAIVETIKRRLGHDNFKAHYTTSPRDERVGKYKRTPPNIFQHITHLK